MANGQNSFMIKDPHSIFDTCSLGEGGLLKPSPIATPQRTKIIARDHETGEILGVYHNKVLVPGSQATVCRQFGLDPVVNFPTYNTELELEHSLDPFPATQPYNTPITCLWCAGRSGAGASERPPGCFWHPLPPHPKYPPEGSSR